MEHIKKKETSKETTMLRFKKKIEEASRNLSRLGSIAFILQRNYSMLQKPLSRYQISVFKVWAVYKVQNK